MAGSHPCAGRFGPKNIRRAEPVDATRSYAAIGQQVGLSAPAVHERVKRMQGVRRDPRRPLRGSTAPAVGKPLLAFIHVDTEGWGVTTDLLALQKPGRNWRRFTAPQGTPT